MRFFRLMFGTMICRFSVSRVRGLQRVVVSSLTSVSRSYVKPSDATTGSLISSIVTGQQKASGGFQSCSPTECKHCCDFSSC